MKRRFLAALLSAVMVLTTLSFMSVTANAVTAYAAGEEYVSLPVIIRDYAADGMLFQWNELGETGDLTVGGSLAAPTVKYTANTGGGAYNATTGDGYIRYTSKSTGIYITYSVSGSHTRTSMRYAVMKYRTNAASASQPTIGHRWNNGGSNNYVNFPTDGYNHTDFKSVVVDLGSGSDTVTHVTLYPRLNPNAYIDIAEVAFFSSKTDADNYASGTATGGSIYHSGSTKGYTLLQTDAKDHFNDLSDIAGTTLTQNGTWGSSDVTSSETTLNSGAKQTLYGCYVRTDLVEPLLDANGKPVYTEAAVTYLANYMQKTLPEPWENSDGSYNMWYVMGIKLFDDNNNYVGNNSSATKDLPSVLRSTITGGLGSYAASTSKTLNQITDCTTYFDAACFLLQSLYSDNEGYGQTVTEYHQINLIKKGDAYVYNSAYDGSVYDTVNGVIYNSQTNTITTREGTTYVRSNLQPETRFDPIAAIGNGNAYYGKSGDVYAKAIGNTSNDNYYNNTNYNLTLEGHAQFIFYEDDNLYFNFTGDDDVYLYINGVRVLDMGGAHAISKCGIYLNDVKDLCGLRDGQVYDFDFYYMERHGTAANFGIETNIKIVDPSMLTEKVAYQDGVNVGNYGYVDANKPVRYQFKLTNNGDAKIEELTFKDNDIGVTLTPYTISLNSETTINDLYASVVDRNGNIKYTYSAGELTEVSLKDLLQNGLEIGDTISIFGFNYTIPADKWSDRKFTNTVYTTAISWGENSSSKNLNGLASCTVQEQTFVYEGIHYYEWMGRGVRATNEELIEAVRKAGVDNPEGNIQLCGPNGKTDSTAINPYAQCTADGITYTGIKTGSDTYYYKVGNYGPVAVTVYSYDVADNVYVLDYSLPVELNGEDFGLMKNDTLTLTENKYSTTASTIGIGDEVQNYGIFTYGTESDPTSLKYTMTDFMNGEDSVEVTVQVLEEGASEVTTRTGVVMTETVKVVPANVVYYEEDFPGITYINTDENGWAHYQTADSEGNEQSADQDLPYGSDPNYQEDKGTEYTLVLDTSDLNAYQQEVIDYLNNLFGYGGDSSNGSINALVVKETADVMSFEFRGTGFEIISRTTQDQYAVVSVKVERKNDDGTYTVVKQFPVITESKGGDLYQVPIISVTGMERADYKVTLKAAGSTETKTRILYIDGVRIYQPLDDVDALEYYNPDEVHAKFYEIKSLIGDGKAIYADISDTGDETLLVTGTTLIEDISEDQLLVSTADVNQYLSLGPNNELYMDGTAGANILAFYLYPVEGVDDNARTIEIGAHRKADYFFGPDPVYMVYGSTADAILEGAYLYSIDSGTEQYYEIDVANLEYDFEKDRYLLMVGANDAEHSYAALALTNLKISGYTIGFAEQETKKAAESNGLEKSPALLSLRAMSNYYKALAPQEPEEEPVEEPKVNEELVINSAVLKADKIVSGKNAILTAKISGDADSLVVLDANGNAVEFIKIASTVRNGIVTFQAVWSVTGSRGDSLSYTVMAYDAEGLRSANTIPITVTIK